MVSRVLQGEAWAAGGDQGRFRMARGPRCVHATGARAYHALIKVVVVAVRAEARVAAMVVATVAVARAVEVTVMEAMVEEGRVCRW